MLASPRSGWQARPFDFERFEALYDLRIVLELAAVERLRASARTGGSAGGPARHLARSGALLDGRRVAELDEAFHCALVEAAGNPEMAQVHRDVTEKIRIVRRLDFTKDFRIDATYEEHGAILSAVLARRADEAARARTSA